MRELLLLSVLTTWACGQSSEEKGKDGALPSSAEDAANPVDASGVDAAHDDEIDSCISQTLYADCDLDGEPAADAPTADSCERRPAVCGGGLVSWRPRPGTDCNDEDREAKTVVDYFPDCDGDELPNVAAEPIASCGIPSEAPDSCGPEEVGAWAPRAEVSDCDDHDQERGVPSEWFADCDEDGFAGARTGSVAQCERPEEVPASCDGTGGWTDLEPIDVPYSAENTTTDCVDQDELVFPGQERFFERASAFAEPANVYDYNCDAETRVEIEGTYRCTISSSEPDMLECVETPGERWRDSVPGCGEHGILEQGCVLIDSTRCAPEDRRGAVQRCR